MPALDRFAFGSNDYPDRSTTLILQVDSLDAGRRVRTAAAPASTAPRRCGRDRCRRTCWRSARPISALFPRGIDLILVADDAIVAIPRTTRIVAKGGN